MSSHGCFCIVLALLNNETSKTEWHSAIARGGKARGAVVWKKIILTKDLGKSDIKEGLVGETENGKLLLQK